MRGGEGGCEGCVKEELRGVHERHIYLYNFLFLFVLFFSFTLFGDVFACLRP